MKLYLEVTDTQYEQIKKVMEKPNLADHTPEELASALFKSIEREGGTVDKDSNMYGYTNGKVANIRRNGVNITLRVGNF